MFSSPIDWERLNGKILEELADEGKAIVVISTDTTEILQLSDRIFVMCQGRVSNIIEGKTDEETLARLIQGKEAAV